MTVPIQPLADYVVAKTEEATSKTAGGIYIPETSAEKPKSAKVLAVGDETKGIKVGDRIIYKDYSSTEVKIGSDTYVLVKTEDILAKLK